MKSINKFLLVSYSSSLIETLALVCIPFLGLYVLSEHGGSMAVAAIVLSLLAAGIALSMLNALESSLATDHVDDRRVRRR